MCHTKLLPDKFQEKLLSLVAFVSTLKVINVQSQHCGKSFTVLLHF